MYFIIISVTSAMYVPEPYLGRRHTYKEDITQLIKQDILQFSQRKSVRSLRSTGKET